MPVFALKALVFLKGIPVWVYGLLALVMTLMGVWAYAHHEKARADHEAAQAAAARTQATIATAQGTLNDTATQAIVKAAGRETTINKQTEAARGSILQAPQADDQ
ncbi:hypothetical protein, partial [Klebsiella pneumoniae]|uniref:hypothetical protein n=1 Tax=Klebsiella pneumoniae TaxID=573 RepID=UPI001E63EB05